MLEQYPHAQMLLTYLTLLEPETYVVGGAVRNHLLNMSFEDIDITTKMRPDKLLSYLKDFNIDKKGLAFGNVKVWVDDRWLSITTFRKDTYEKSHRFPSKVSFVDTLEEDLLRRDFTINTICWHSQKGIVGLMDGQRDLNRLLIQCVKSPMISFNEDALRILRALRFCCEYDFDCSDAVVEGIAANHQLVGSLGIGQLRSEISRIIRAEYYEKKKRQYHYLFKLLRL